VLLCGDLNEAASECLLSAGTEKSFLSDVVKIAHHGSADFSIDFLKEVSPYASIISSGDNESYSHPRADAIGCCGKYGRGEKPFVFSTELARSYSKKKLLFGMINLRTDGNRLVIAQMKEKRTGADIWDSYILPK